MTVWFLVSPGRSRRAARCETFRSLLPCLHRPPRRSALGLEAQRDSVRRFISSVGGELIAEITEVESGRKNDRPELQRALAECRRKKATLAIARLDRLARNATFLLQLRDSNVEFAAADMPNADRFIVGILALVAERERDMISIRTTEALAAAKRRGVILGSPNPRKGSALGVAAVQTKIGAFDSLVLPIVEGIRRAGVTAMSDLATALNARGLKTRLGSEWSHESVRTMIRRAA